MSKSLNNTKRFIPVILASIAICVFTCLTLLFFFKISYRFEMSFPWKYAVISVIVLLLLHICIYTVVFFHYKRQYVQHSEAVLKMVSYLSRGDYSHRADIPAGSILYEFSCELNHLADTLKHIEESDNSFIASVSHDMKTPMTTVTGFVDCILCGAVSQKKSEEYLIIIKNEIKRLSGLVDSLLTVSKYRSGDMCISKTSFDVCELIRIILISFEKFINEKQLKVDCDFYSYSTFVSADKDKIYEVIYNLIDNAVKFSYENTVIDLCVKKDTDSVRISVRNEGPGVDPDDRPFIFDKFYQSNNTKTGNSGSGLGLYICNTILNAHGTELCVNSETGSYCEFSFLLQSASDQI